MELILDTEFVIALERERRKSESGPARRFLAQHEEDRFYITFTVAGELACGRSVAEKRAWEGLCKPFGIIGWSAAVSWEYGELFRKLQESGKLIGANDLWIAATTLSRGGSLVSNNVRDFGRVPKLALLRY